MGQSPVVTRSAQGHCTCPVPVPEVRAVWKGAARTYCARCNREIRLDFAAR
jgi:hypothetical protein